MTDSDQQTAHIDHQRGPWLSAVWIIPLVAVLVGGWLFYQNVLARGALVTLELPNAEGLEAGRTAVKIRNVEVGKVEDVRLTADYSGTIAEIRMDRDATGLLVEDTRFWVVKPRIGRRGISGLNTILSGAYVQMQPGESDEPRYRFQALEQPPVMESDAPGLSLRLTGREQAALSVGDPVLYQGREAGRVETAEFDAETQQMRYQIFVDQPYDSLIRRNTQFWNRSGVDVQLSSEGVQVNLGSLEAMLAGGVTFGLPEDVPPGGSVSNGDHFDLFPSRDAAQQDRFDQQIEYIVLVRDSVRGLNPGAQLAFRGIRVGTVTDVPFFTEAVRAQDFEDFRIPVRILFEPQRLGPAWGDRSLEEWRKRLDGLFERGLRASVRPGNLLTGAMYMDMQIVEEPEPRGMEMVGDYPVFPSTVGGFTGIEQKISTLLDKLNNLDIEPTLNRLGDTLASSDRTFEEMASTLDTLNQVLRTDEARSLPAELEKTLREIQRTLGAYREGQPVYDQLDRALQQLTRVLDDLGPLADTLRERPDALLFGREPEDDPMPRAPR